MALRKVTFRMYPNAAQTERMVELLGLHQRVYNTALEERIRAYRERSETSSSSIWRHMQALDMRWWNV